MTRKIFNAIPGIVIALLILSCEDNVTNNYIITDATPEGKVVSDNPAQILSFDEVSALESGTTLKLRLNRSGTIVKEYDITFDGVYISDGERLIICTTPKGLPVGSGDSGSPVLTADGKVVASLCYGWEFANNQFAARAIEDVLSINNDEPTQKSSSLFQPINCVQFISGIDENTLSRYDQRDDFGLMDKVSVDTYTKTSGSSLKSGAIEGHAIPGMTIAVLEVHGDLITSGAYGTVSYLDGDHIYAFGHGYGSDAPLGAYTAEAEMSAFIGSEQNGFKLAMSTNRGLGAFTVDKANGVMIDKSVEPNEFTHTVSINISGTLAHEYSSCICVNHSVANSTSSRNDFYYATYLTAYSVYNKILEESELSLSASCNFECKLKNGSIYTGSFNSISTKNIDESIFYSLYDYLLVDHDFVDNIKEFKITINLTDITSD